MDQYIVLSFITSKPAIPFLKIIQEPRKIPSFHKIPQTKIQETLKHTVLKYLEELYMSNQFLKACWGTFLFKIQKPSDPYMLSSSIEWNRNFGHRNIYYLKCKFGFG